MALKDAFEELKQFKLDQLDPNNIGAWPVAIKGLVLALLALVVLGLGFFLVVKEQRKELAKQARTEVDLRGQFQQKAFEAHNIDALRHQSEELEESLKELKRQLPQDTEVPSLLEDITNTALESNLKIESVDLRGEQESEIYVELPIEIKVEGSYHDLASFVSGVANLSRIVTLHDFTLEPRRGAEHLAMTIEAKTYRYRESEEETDAAAAAAAPADGAAAPAADAAGAAAAEAQP